MKFRMVAMALMALAGSSIAQGAETITPELVARAKSEGEVVWYSTLPIPETQAWSSLFTKKYGIKVSLFRTGVFAYMPCLWPILYLPCSRP